MIQITPQIRILVAVESIDARKGIDSLAQLCREKLAADPITRTSSWRCSRQAPTYPTSAAPNNYRNFTNPERKQKWARAVLHENI